MHKFITIFRYILEQGVVLPAENSRSQESKEKKYAQCLLPWLTKQIERDPEIPSCLNNPLYRDKNSTLMRLFNSATYAYKVFCIQLLIYFVYQKDSVGNVVFSVSLLVIVQY